MMKVLKYIILCLTILINYNVKAQDTNTSEFDKTIDKLIPKAKKNKLNEKQLALFTNSYHEANVIDHNIIMNLKKSGQPEIWIEIYHKLTSINERQDKIKPLPDNIKTAMNFKELNLDNEISNSKEKAELYICAKVNLLLKNINEENITEANKLIRQLSKINPQSGNIGDLMLKSIILQSKRILFRVIYPIESYIPQEWIDTILDFDTNIIYGIPFDVVADKDTKYDLTIRIMVDEKSISPERIDAVTFEEKKDNIGAVVTDKTMTKSATLKGKIQIIDVKNDEILINTPYFVTSTFRYQYAEVSGDKSACTEETLLLLNRQVIDFPSDESLLKDASSKLNQLLKSHYLKK